MKKHIPNMITCCNLLSGSVAVYLATEEQYVWSLCLIILAAIFDFFDGMTARLLGVSSPIGKELDSLADDISFGLAPSMMLFCYLKPIIGWWALIALLMAAFSALRLAKFNLDERQTTSFIGLATPANALFWAANVANQSMQNTIMDGAVGAYTLLALSLVSCWLLVSEIPFFSLKFHDLSWKENKIRFIFLIGTAIIMITYCVLAIVFKNPYALIPIANITIVWYVLLSLLTLRKTK